MSIFLGFFPDSRSNTMISSLTDSVKSVFADLDIKVR